MNTAYEPRGWCRGCGYRIEAGVCPECGAANDKPLTRDPKRSVRRVTRRAGACLCVAGLAALGWWWRDEIAFRIVPIDTLFWLRDDVLPKRPSALDSIRSCVDRVLSVHETSLEAIALEKIERTPAMQRRRVIAESDREFELYANFDTRFAIARSGAFVYASDHNVNEPDAMYDGYGEEFVNWGRATRDGERIVLHPAIDRRFIGTGICPLELVTVPWRGATLLVPVEEMGRFIKFLNGGFEVRALETAWIHVNDTLAHDNSLPVVPAEYADLLLAVPVTAHITAILGRTSNKSGCAIRLVELDRGTSTGIRAGVELYGLDAIRTERGCRVACDVVLSDASTSVGVVTLSAECLDTTLRVGEPFSTRAPDIELEQQVAEIDRLTGAADQE